ncbi:hypothetical protein O7621_12190 [Solwaraspora sp. WMMD937]|uniref:hypothetical protein n=1 Tax=Solwaraspora sp. WMMD937 TaxID=3016090 RepID=UPI00249BDCF5|nr:hypothetical protein [Solwaraspora sp. WMMD937]WFE23957.1 hypothetical protein O7621_12190 [Solwaraspora sp. WMMD937]
MSSPPPAGAGPKPLGDSHEQPARTRGGRLRVTVLALIVLLIVVIVTVAVTMWAVGRSPSEPTTAGPAAATTAGPTASAGPAGSGTDDELLITTRGIGPLRLSGSVAELTATGALGTEPGDFCSDRLVGNDEFAGVVVHTAEDGIAAMIVVEGSSLSTAEGVTVGSTRAELREAYGEQLTRHTAENNPYSENYLVSSGTLAIGFTVSQDAVGKILVAPTEVLRTVYDAGEFHC